MPAHASESQEWEAGDIAIRAGVAALRFDSSATVILAGTPVPDGGARLSNATTATADIAWFLTRNISAALMLGLPPQTRITPTGTLAPLGEAGRLRYGLGAVVARVHLPASSALQPFAGVGLGRLDVLREHDGAVQNLQVKSRWAPVVQAGIDLHLSRRVGVYAGATYAPLKTDASGVVMNLPMTARITLNPTILHAGVFTRF